MTTPKVPTLAAVVQVPFGGPGEAHIVRVSSQACLAWCGNDARWMLGEEAGPPMDLHTGLGHPSTPSVLPDGRVVFWGVDHLTVVGPDGVTHRRIPVKDRRKMRLAGVTDGQALLVGDATATWLQLGSDDDGQSVRVPALHEASTSSVFAVSWRGRSALLSRFDLGERHEAALTWPDVQRPDSLCQARRLALVSARAAFLWTSGEVVQLEASNINYPMFGAEDLCLTREGSAGRELVSFDHTGGVRWVTRCSPGQMRRFGDVLANLDPTFGGTFINARDGAPLVRPRTPIKPGEDAHISEAWLFPCGIVLRVFLRRNNAWSFRYVAPDRATHAVEHSGADEVLPWGDDRFATFGRSADVAELRIWRV